MKELKILSPCGILGYGFPEESFNNGVKQNPDLIAVDAGSTDAGPHKLGAGVGIVSKRAVKKDLSLIFKAGYELGIPIIIGSAGGSGAKPHNDWTMNIIREIVKENNYKFKTAVIYADIDKNYVKKKLLNSKVKPLGPVHELTEDLIDKTTSIVGQMGVEPIIKALNEGCQLIVCGRAYDPAAFAAYPISLGYDPGLAFHLGKILECGALCAEPGTTRDCIMGYLGEDYFEVEPCNPERKCKITSVAAHTLYEKDHPYILYGPGMELNLKDCEFEQITPSRVRVTKSKYIKPNIYTIKIEGASKVAYRTFVVAGIRDPLMIENLEMIEENVKETIISHYSDIDKNSYKIIFHNYGINGVMGSQEQEKFKGHEVCIIIDIVASDQETASAICASCRSTLLHYGYPNRKSTAGNLAFPFAPSDIEFGPVYKFTIYHLVNVDDPNELFKIEKEIIGG